MGPKLGEAVVQTAQGAGPYPSPSFPETAPPAPSRYRVAMPHDLRTELFEPKGHHAPGTAPGTIAKNVDGDPTTLRAVRYGPETLERFEPATAEDPRLEPQAGTRLWIDLVGLANGQLLAQLGRRFGLHPLALEDATNTHQRPKFENYPGHFFFVLRMLRPGRDRIESEQVSLFVTDHAVISVQEHEGDAFDPVRRRLENPRAQVRGQPPSFLAYALLDAAVDYGFPVLESVGDRLAQIEEAIIETAPRSVVQDLYFVRRDLLALRRTFAPLREALQGLERSELGLLEEDTRIYLRDARDHVLQLMDNLDSYRELGHGLFDVYLSIEGQRANEVQKTLTLVGTIFIPLGFLAGLYGMNFEHNSPYNMPELHWVYGYPTLLAAMAAIALGLLAWFYRKGWLGER